MVEKEHFDLVASDYDQRASRGFWGWLKAKEVSSVLATVGKPTNILDIGCGTGIYAAHISAQVPACQFMGLDKSSAMIQEFEKRGFSGKCVNLETSFFSQGSFDLILSLGLLEFVRDLGFIQETIKRSSAQGTRFLVLVPKFNFLNVFYLLYHRLKGNRVHLRTTNTYTRVFAKDGFEFKTSMDVTPVSRLLVFQKS